MSHFQDSDQRRPWRHFTQNGAATWWMHTQCIRGTVQQRPPVPDLW